MKKIVFILVLFLYLTACKSDPKADKTLYGLWECTSEQFDKGPAQKPSPAYILDVSGRCEDIQIQLTNGGKDLANMNEVKGENAKCFGNRDELSFFASNVMSGVDFKLKMDASRDTLHGTYELPQGETKTNWQICKVTFVRVP